jgi:hypothetical protein
MTELSPEAITEIQQALELIEEAQELVESALQSLPDHMGSHFEAYGKYGFDQLLNNGNRYDYGLQDIIDEVEQGEDYRGK